MAEIVQMPKMSDTMEEGVIAAWHKKVGDTVESGELMAEIETDKATMEYESYNDGTVLYLGGEIGDAIAVNGVLAIVGEQGEDISGLLASAQNGSSEPQEEKSPEQTGAGNTEENIDVSAINAEIVRMPKMSDTMEEGVIAEWHKKVGDSVESGELMAEIETDKATMEYESYNDGTVLYIGAEKGEGIPVDGVLAIVGEPGADWESLLKAEKAGGSSQVPEVKEESNKVEAPEKVSKPQASTAEPSKAASSSDDDRVKASPLAKKIAKDKGYSLSDINGSGPNGRIVKDDVENYTPSAKPSTASSDQATVTLPTVVGEESFEEKRVTQMRKAIGKRLAESKYSAPHFYVTMEIDMDKAIEARKSMNEVAPVKISFNDMVVKACATALRKHPQVNSSFQGDTIRENHHIHVGVAVAVDEGLLVPTIRFTDSKGLAHISTEVRDFAGRAKEGTLQPEEYQGSTFTVSNLGMFGVEEFTAIINAPNACILAVGGIKQTPVVKNGEVVPGNVMKVTLSSDHRVVDGAVAAAFLKTLKGLLEDPVRILI